MFKLSSLCLWLIAGLALFSPLADGVFPILPTAVILGGVFALSIYAFHNPGVVIKRIALAAVSICIAITIADVMARPLLSTVEERPTTVFAHPLPDLLKVYRFNKSLDFRGSTFGDLAALSGKKEWREQRELVFQTDYFGFRNRPDPGNYDSLDLIILGDSYGVGDGTSQEKTWPSILSQQYGLNLYNLSMDGASPWEEYINYLLEADRLKTREGTTLLWLLFTGNDLIDPCYPAFKRNELPRLGALGKLIHKFETYRYDSPLRRVLFLRGQHSDRDDVMARSLPDGRTILFDQAYARLAALSLDEVMRHANYENVKNTFAAMKHLTDERHLRLVVAVAPSKEEVYDWVLNQRSPWSSRSTDASGFAAAIKNLTEANGITFLDLKTPLVDVARKSHEQSGELLWWRDDTHWNEAGHRAVASILYENLLRPLAGENRQLGSH